MNIHLITHTHWDREWYRTYQEFRIFLVRLLKEYLDYFQGHPTYHAFILDGQTVQLEDFLEIYPEDYEQLKMAIQQERLMVGPMYIQPDEFLPSGEALIRNFLVGMNVAERFGTSMPIGYFPDSFGHASQIPQILRGFGLKTVLLWRGVCDEDTELTEFLWQSRDGSRVMVIWMPFSYGNAHLMGLKPQGIRATLESAVETLGPMATTDNILLMKGWDHSGFSPETPQILIEASKQLSDAITLIHSDPILLEAAIRKENPDLQTLRGEFRKPKYMRIHAGITSTRMDIKQANLHAQHELEQKVEPISTFAWLAGREYPKAMIDQAWKYLLQSQAHDSICCCCTDEALRSVKNRFMDSLEISKAILRQESMSYALQVQTDQHSGSPFLVVNPYPRTRTQVVGADLLVPAEEFRLVNSNGEEIPYQITKQRIVYLGLDPSVSLSQKTVERTEGEILEAVGQRPDDPAIYYDQSSYVPLSDRAKGIEAHQVTIHFPIQKVPASGYKTYFVQAGPRQSECESDLSVFESGMENQHLRLSFNVDGSFSLLDKETGHEYTQLHYFEDGGDAGDSYNYSPPRSDHVVTTKELKASVELRDQGPFVASYQIHLEFPIPSGLDQAGDGRSSDSVSLPIESEIILRSGARYVEIQTRIENLADDHRLRVLFPSGLKSSVSYAEEQFGVIERLNQLPQAEYWKKEGWVEEPLPLYPMQRFVDLNDGEKGIAVFNKDLTEYEVIGAEKLVLALTLLRSVGAMGRPDLVIRPGRASGLEVPTPDGLCHGIFDFHYAIHPHAGSYDGVAAHAADFVWPLQIVQTERSPGVLPPETSFFEILTDGLITTCLKCAQRENAAILRFYNSTGNTISQGELRVDKRFTRVDLVDLKEDSLGKLEAKGEDSLYFLPDVKSSEIITLKLSQA
ncbi:MAG: glycoside hydrolase family 38 C-terminal domain-containing protein [Anaerolineales bacterium]|jgi:mannosylglycerate hydrolase